MDVTSTGLNTRILKEPLGFIRIIQLPLAIFALATTAGYSHVIEIPHLCAATGSIVVKLPVEFGYPFDLTSIKVPGNFCLNAQHGKTIVLFSNGAMSRAQFFVCTGVLSFIFVLAILAIYLLSWNNYSKDPRWSVGDFFVTGILSIFWFIGTCAWASGVSQVKSVTDPETIGKRLRESHGAFPCNTDPTAKMCTPAMTWNYASLNISLILGFACIGVWYSSLWFIYKETPWYKSRTVMGAADAGAGASRVTGQPAMASGIGSGNMRQQTSEYQY